MALVEREHIKRVVSIRQNDERGVRQHQRPGLGSDR